MGASQSSTYQPSITGLSKKDGKLVFKKIDDTEESIPIDTVSIQTVVVDSEGKLIITRTDGTQDGPFNIKGNTGEKGESIIGPKGDSIIGPKGDSIVGPPGKDSMIPGPKGDSIVGPQGEGIKDLTVSEQGFATITTTSDRKFGPFNVKGNTGAIGSQGPSGKDSDLNYAKFETTMKTKSVWCDNGNCVTPGNSTVNGDISGKSIGRNQDDIEWFRIFGTKIHGTALYNGLSIGQGGGLYIGNGSDNDFKKIPAGKIEATGDITSGGKITVINNTDPNITLQTSSLGGGTINFGNPNHGVKRDGNDVVMFTAGEASLKLRNDGVDTLVSKANELTIKGKITANGRDILAELDDLKENAVRKDKQYALLSNHPNGFYATVGGYLGRGAVFGNGTTDKRLPGGSFTFE